MNDMSFYDLLHIIHYRTFTTKINMNHTEIYCFYELNSHQSSIVYAISY